MTDEQLAQQFRFQLSDFIDFQIGEFREDAGAERFDASLAVLLARRALEEARWWPQHFHAGHSRNCTFDNATGDEGDYCSCGLSERKREMRERIAALEQAAASKADGGGGQ